MRGEGSNLRRAKALACIQPFLLFVLSRHASPLDPYRSDDVVAPGSA